MSQSGERSDPLEIACAVPCATGNIERRKSAAGDLEIALISRLSGSGGRDRDVPGFGAGSERSTEKVANPMKGRNR